MKRIVQFVFFLLVVGSLQVVAQVPSYVPTSGLAGWWPFNGNANDESGNGNNGTAMNGVALTTDRNGNANSAYSFDGVDDYIQVLHNNSSMGDMTMSAWVYSTVATGGPFVHIGRDNGNNGSTPSCNGVSYGKGGTTLSNGGFNLIGSYSCVGSFSSGTSFASGLWQHCVMVLSSGVASFYINGVFVGSSSVGNYITPSNFIYMGSTSDGYSALFNGKLDDIGIWNRALNSNEVYALYSGGQPNPCLPSYVPTNGLVGWWPFCGNANDESGNGNHGTTMNGVALTTDRNGNANSAYNFDGVDDWINIQNTTNVNFNTSMSVFAWVRLNNTQNNFNAILTKWENETPGLNENFWFGTYGTEIHGAFSGTGCGSYCSSQMSSTASINSNNWDLIGLSYSNAKVYYYKNGVLIDSDVVAASISSSSATIKIGRQNIISTINSNHFNGKLDDIGIWNRALTPAEITALYQSGQPCPSISNIQGPSNVNVGSTITLTDSTANGTWSSSNPAVATISASGVLTGVSAGTTTVSYIANLTCGPDTATYSVTVNPNPCLPSYVPTNGLVGWWPFCGNANDESGNGNHGTTMNGVVLTTDRNGNANSTYNFDGVDDYILINNTPSLELTNNFTISSWIDGNIYLPQGPQGIHMIVSKRSNNISSIAGSYSYGIWGSGIGSEICFQADPNAGPQTYAGVPGRINVNNWYNFICSYNKGLNELKYYLNGVLVFTTTLNFNITSTGDPISFGCLGTAGGYFFNGKIDDIGIWNRALTPAEIQALYLSGQPCTVTHTTSLNLCRRDSTLWNGQYYSRTGADTVHLTSYRGCDSIDILNLNVYPLYYTVITQYFCKGKSFVFNGQTISTAGTYYFHYTSATGCDSTVRLRALYRSPIPTTNVTLPICVGGTVSYGGQTFSAPGIYKVTLQAYNACDSVVQLTLVIRSKTYGKATIYRCPNDSVAYYGKYYKTNGVYAAIIPNRYGCDSVVTLNVLTRPSSYSVQTNYICQGDSLLYQGVYYKQSGTYFIHLTNRYGCDSTVRLRLLYNNSSSLTTVTLCHAQIFTWNGTTYTWSMAGTYTAHFINYKGCDSIATLKIYKGNCKETGEAIGTTITITEETNAAEATNATSLEAAQNFEMRIYPNPNTGRFTLENNCTSCKQMHIEIMTLDGKLLYAQDADNSTGKINIDLNLVPGMYWVKMSNGKEGYNRVEKVIIEN